MKSGKGRLDMTRPEKTSAAGGAAHHIDSGIFEKPFMPVERRFGC